jgi:hypothetical protein
MAYILNSIKSSTIFRNFVTAQNNPNLRSTTGILNKFDEPTYLSFKVRFDSGELNYNSALVTANYDWMPHPLLESKTIVTYKDRPKYSSITYLQDSDETNRAELLTEFQEKLNILQNHYQWYFQSITGIQDLFNINTKRGFRVPEDFRLTIKCLEGVDLRMSYLMSLYRRIAWDDEYQRWILPDMMRYFKLRIYVTEFRSFHIPFNQNYNSLTQDVGDGKKVTSTSQVSSEDIIGNTGNSAEYMALQLIDYYMPTFVIDCEQCEFDIESNPYLYLADMNVTTPNEATAEIKIKVGKARILQHFPQFKHAFLDDFALNKPGGRRLDVQSTPGASLIGVTISSPTIDEGPNKGHKESRILDNGDAGEPHISGMPWWERANSNELIKQTGNAVEETWTENAIKFGEAFIRNTVEKVIDKATITPIPGIGVSLSQATTVIESKDIFSVFALVRQALRNISEGTLAPSAKLDDAIIDGTLMAIMNSLSKSEATDPPSMALAQAANIILNDRGAWEKIKDYSLATDLLSKGESNLPNSITSPTTQASTIAESIRNDKSWATSSQNSLSAQKGLIFEGAPSSATSKKEI